MKGKRVATILLAGAISVSSVLAFSGCGAVFGIVNYEDWSAKISKTTLKSSVYVEKRGAGGTQGSGMIFYESPTHYYALTNNHVVYKGPLESFTYTVTDCYDELSSASVLYSDASYDLAVLTFPKPSQELVVTPLAESSPAVFQTVALISNPSGRHNSLTFGRVRRYAAVEIGSIGDVFSDVTFPVMAHGCYGEGGSSGGGIVNQNLQLVGVHYACGYTEEGESVEGYAVPVEKVREFLEIVEMAKDIDFGV